MTGETFADLLAPNLHSVRMFVRSRLRSSDHVDDILQQTLLRAFSRRHQLRAPSKFRSWLWSIAMNEIRMFLRGARHSVSLDEFPDFPVVDHAPSPLTRCEQAQRADRLHAGMSRLTERDRTTIRLVDLDGLSIAEAAGAMAISAPAAKSAHFRARQRLGEALRV